MDEKKYYIEIKRIEHTSYQVDQITEDEAPKTKRDRNEDWSASLLNDTDNVITMFGTQVGNQNIKWVPINPIGRTCNGDIQACFDNGNYRIMFVEACIDPQFDLYVGWKTGPNTVRAYGPWVVTPTCQYAGAVFPIS
jgi:hypothetical protein